MGLLLNQFVDTWSKRGDNPSMNVTLGTFADRVEWLLRQRDMSQKQLAAHVEVSEQFLSALIKGKRKPNVKHLTRIASALDTSVDFLALVTDDPTPQAQADVPIYFSAEADAAAKLVDAMQPDKRAEAVALLRVLADFATTAERADAAGDSPSIAPVPGARGGGLVLGALAKKRATT